MQKRKKHNGPNLAMLSVCAALAAAPTIASASTLYWDPNGGNPTGATASNGAWDLVTANWNPNSDGSGTQQTYAAGSDVIFSAGSTLGTAGVTVAASITTNSMTFADSATTLSGAVSSSSDSITIGAGGITINSGATASTTNVSTGSAGSVNILVGASQTWTNNGSGTFLVASGGLLSSAYTLTLSAGIFQFGNSGNNNSFTGGGTINVDGGTLNQANSSGGIGNSVIFTAGTYINSAGKAAPAFTLAGNFNIGQGKTAGFGNVTLASASTSYTLTVNSNGSTTFEGQLIGAEAGQTLTISGGSTATDMSVGFNSGANNPNVILGGNSAANFFLVPGTMQGSLTLNGGTGIIDGVNTVASGVVTKGVTGVGTFHLGGSTLIGVTATTDTIAVPVSLDGNVTFGSASTGYTGAIFIDGSTLSTPSTVLLTTSPTLTLVQPTTIADAITDSGAGLGFTKAGASTLTLTGLNTYSGTTAISAGTLAVNSTSTSAALTKTSAITIASTGALSLVDNASSPNLINDAATITVASGAGSIIDLELNGYQEDAASFVIGSTAQPTGLYGSATFFTDTDTVPSSAALADESYFTGDGGLEITGAVPEPASAGVLLAATSLLALRRRRRIVS